MPCAPNDINITEPDGPPLPGIPGFGDPFAPKLPEFPFPEGFPEDLLELFNSLAMLLPPGSLKPSLNPNFGKDIFDAIMSLLDKFFPFLMLYKFFLPILNLIICIIEVLCAIANPFKLIRALKRLFRNCIPEFLSLFPIFALIVMLLSLLFLLLALIEYIILQILRIIQMLLRNIRAIVKAVTKADAGAIAAITKKLGILLCCFQNIFVILAIFAVIIQVIKDMLKLLFAIPPCDDGDPSDTENCCTPEVCPDFIRNNEEFIRFTGAFQYYQTVTAGTGVLPPPFDVLFSVNKRVQSYQMFDTQAPIELQVINISDAFDVTENPKPVFFPTEVTYSAATPPKQAPYKVDLRLPYNPTNWGRSAPITNTIINTSGGGVVGTTTTFTNGTDVLIPDFIPQNPVFFQVVNTSTNKVEAAANDGILTANARNAVLTSASVDFGIIAGLTNFKLVIVGGGYGTTIAVSSDAKTLPQTNINVLSTINFPTNGTILVFTDAGLQTITYTGTTSTSFIGCTGGAGTMSTGAVVSNTSVENRGGFVIASGAGHILNISKPPYDPATANTRFIRFNDCIVLIAPNRNYTNYDNTTITIGAGVLILAGGAGTEDNGTALLGFETDGTTQSSSPATLENFLFLKPITGTDPPLLPGQGIRFDNIEYKFKINHEVLLGKALITLGCIPTVAIDRTFANTIFGGSVGLNYTLLNALVLPDVTGCQACLQAALDALRLDMSEQGVAEFQATTNVCLAKLKADSESSIKGLIGIGFDPYKSVFTLVPEVQFTSKKIKIQVQLNEGNGLSITDNLPESIALDMETRLKAKLNFGFIGPFKYDGSKLFETTISSDQAGAGVISISFDNKFISVVTIPSDIDIDPTVVIKELPFSFVFTPTSAIGDATIRTGRGDTDGAPRRDTDDLSTGNSEDNRGG